MVLVVVGASHVVVGVHCQVDDVVVGVVLCVVVVVGWLPPLLPLSPPSVKRQVA